MFEQLSIMTQRFDTWLSSDTSNYYGYILIAMLIIIGGLVTAWYFKKKIGEADERTAPIHSRIERDMLATLVISSAVFVSVINQNTEHIQQLYLIPFAVTAVAGAVSGLVRFRRSS